jgi:hypothetical protein
VEERNSKHKIYYSWRDPPPPRIIIGIFVLRKLGKNTVRYINHPVSQKWCSVGKIKIKLRNVSPGKESLENTDA